LGKGNRGSGGDSRDLPPNFRSKSENQPRDPGKKCFKANEFNLKLWEGRGLRKGRGGEEGLSYREDWQ